MMRWLDPLGWLKWPSLLLVASPLAAYPFWSPEPEPAAECGLVAVEGQTFRVFMAADGSAFILRPTSGPVGSARGVETKPATGFDAGGMVIGADDPALAGSACSPDRGS